VADNGSDLNRNVGFLSSLLLLLLCNWLIHHIHYMALEAQKAAHINRFSVAEVKEWQQAGHQQQPANDPIGGLRTLMAGCDPICRCDRHMLQEQLVASQTANT
jgi:hypothetical protein